MMTCVLELFISIGIRLVTEGRWIDDAYDAADSAQLILTEMYCDYDVYGMGPRNGELYPCALGCTAGRGGFS